MNYKEAVDYLHKYSDYIDIEDDPDYTPEEIIAVAETAKKEREKK